MDEKRSKTTTTGTKSLSQQWKDYKTNCAKWYESHRQSEQTYLQQRYPSLAQQMPSLPQWGAGTVSTKDEDMMEKDALGKPIKSLNQTATTSNSSSVLGTTQEPVISHHVHLVVPTRRTSPSSSIRDRHRSPSFPPSPSSPSSTSCSSSPSSPTSSTLDTTSLSSTTDSISWSFSPGRATMRSSHTLPSVPGSASTSALASSFASTSTTTSTSSSTSATNSATLSHYANRLQQAADMTNAAGMFLQTQESMNTRQRHHAWIRALTGAMATTAITALTRPSSSTSWSDLLVPAVQVAATLAAEDTSDPSLTWNDQDVTVFGFLNRDGNLNGYRSENLSYEHLSRLTERLGSVRTGAASTQAIQQLPVATYQPPPPPRAPSSSISATTSSVPSTSSSSSSISSRLNRTSSTAATNDHKHASASSGSKSKTPDSKASCSICLESFSAGESIKTLPCLHRFHASCVDNWLNRKGTCPICRHAIE